MLFQQSKCPLIVAYISSKLIESNHALTFMPSSSSLRMPSLSKKVSLFSSSSYGKGMDQNAMMESDLLIAVDENDEIVSKQNLSKKQAHIFSPNQPRGVAHRAFSVFLFNNKNELLLTKRASTKITFPDVWTNTCCSHPLRDMVPDEMDHVSKAFPSFPGIKHAAIRKLCHELGMDTDQLPIQDFQFISRFHYWASDTHTYGLDTTWGEHEIDYVLFLQCNDENIILNPNIDEVGDYKYVSIEELKSMIYDDNNNSYLWSPWFIGIMERGGFYWWEHLQESLEGKFINKDIVFFDPPIEFWARYNLHSHTPLTGVLSAEPSYDLVEK